VTGAARPARRRAAPAAVPAAALLAAALAAGCASAPAPPPVAPPPAPASVEEPAPPAAPAAAPTPPWEIPPELLDRQRLYRVRYDGPEGEGGLRLTLWLADPDRYDARAADQLGRPLWSLSVRGAGGLWVDHRAEAWCRLDGALDLAGLPLAPFPLAALPPLLLGRLPARPAGGVEPPPGASAIEIVDGEGRRWTAELGGGAPDGGAPVSWTLWGRDAAAGPVLTWVAAGGEAVLSDRGAGVQLRWREAVSEPLGGLPAPLEPPAGYREASCAAAAG
jgi:hypothetical protein